MFRRDDRRFLVSSRSAAFQPGHGTMGGVGSAAATFSGGLAGVATNYVVAPDASLDERFLSGEPGIYRIRMVVTGVPVSDDAVDLFTTAPYQAAMDARGLDAVVTSVDSVNNRNPRRENWAGAILDEVMGNDPSAPLIVDKVFTITVNVYGKKAGDGMSGMGAIPLAVGLLIVVAITSVIAAIWPAFGNVVLESAKFVGKLVGGLVGGVATAVAENAIPVLLMIGVGALAIAMMKKSGAKFTSKSGRFSF